jgi:hypothetical protein
VAPNGARRRRGRLEWWHREDDRTEEERHNGGASRPHCGSGGSARVSKTPAKLQGMEDEERERERTRSRCRHGGGVAPLVLW